jgi:hypothetical protein
MAGYDKSRTSKNTLLHTDHGKGRNCGYMGPQAFYVADLSVLATTEYGVDTM